MRLILLLLTALTLPAFAADPGEGLRAFSPPPGDVSVDFLRQIFGPIVDGMKAGAGVAQGQTVVGAMMGVFNLAVLSLAMIFVLFTTVKGTIDSAHDGKVLGQKMSEIWIPIRTVTGTALLLPSASGFSLIQIAILWLAAHGVGVADAVWTAAMQKLAVNGTLGHVSVPDSRPLAANILRAEVCMAAMNKQYEAEDRKTRITVLPLETIKTGIDQGTTALWRWGSNDFLNPAVCGSISWVRSDADTKTAGQVKALRQPILDAHINAVWQMVQDLRPVAGQIVAWQRPTPGAVDQVASRYEDAITVAAKAAVDASPDVAQEAFIKDAELGGWVLAGTWFNHMIRVNDTIQAAVNTVPVSTPVRIDDLEVKETLIAYRDALVFTDEYLKNRGEAPRRSYETAIEDSKSIRSADDVWRLLSIPAMMALDAFTQRVAGANTSPLMQLRALGNDLVTAGVVIKASMFVIAGFAGSRAVDWSIGNAFNIAEALRTISSTVEWASSTLWALGAVLAYYLPAIPAIWWVMGVVRWLASVAEAVLAAPLMAAMHVHPGGDDVVGRAGPGYMLILAMVIQPALLLAGLILAALMTYPAGALVNMMFLGMVAGAAGSSAVGIVALIAWSALYVVMMVVAIHACFALIAAVPENVMRWVGGQAGAQGIGTQGEKGAGGLEGGAAGAGAAVAKPKSDKHQSGASSKSVENSVSNADHLSPD